MRVMIEVILTEPIVPGQVSSPVRFHIMNVTVHPVPHLAMHYHHDRERGHSLPDVRFIKDEDPVELNRVERGKD